MILSQVHDELHKGNRVTTRVMGTESKLKVLNFDSMVHSKGTCNQEQLPWTGLAETNALEWGKVQMDLIQLSNTTEQVPKSTAREIVK